MYACENFFDEKYILNHVASKMKLSCEFLFDNIVVASVMPCGSMDVYEG
uniref:Uncharacterized protein n=1 Tax=Rhizophora mucronata TaxID=61149 RepID=A0A2P2QMV4_RHIMU